MKHIQLIDLRSVSTEVQMRIRDWRNASHIKKFFQLPYISKKQHKKWIKALFEDAPTTIAFIIAVDSIYVGLTYFQKIDFFNKRCDWGIYIYELSCQQQGIGSNVMAQCLKYARHTLNLDYVYLEVLAHNTLAIKMYEKYNFKLIANNNDVLLYKGVINENSI